MIATVVGLTKTFGRFKAVDNLTFGLEQGEIVGLVGPNGAGKTTTLHMMLGLISPSAGDIRLFDRRLGEEREEILQRLNFTSPYMAFPGRLTVRENLKVLARMYKVRNPDAKISDLLERFGIAHLHNKPVARLSSGETTRAGLCKGFLNDPELLLLDEPTAYLDPHAAAQVRDILLDLQRLCGTSIFYCSHNMREIQYTCNRIMFLNHGRIVASGTAIDITRQILQEDRDQPALDEAFAHVAKHHSHETASH
jgi:ABC-2 type transport system ATP-binding protein